MRTINIKVFKYEELSDDAKARARDWWRQGRCGDADSLEHVIEDAATCGALLGIDLRTRSVKLMGGGTRLEPCVYWSGFSSQGDGACFEGNWTAKDVGCIKLRQHAPDEKELHRIADALAQIASDYPDASASTKQSGHYSHSGCMQVVCDSGIDLDETDDNEARAEAFPEDDLIQLLRDFADWIYRSLEKEYEYQNADEQVAENIIANEYEFTSDGFG